MKLLWQRMNCGQFANCSSNDRNAPRIRVFLDFLAAEIAARRGIEAPIIAAVDAVLKGGLSIADAVSALLSRPLKSEVE